MVRIVHRPPPAHIHNSQPAHEQARHDRDPGRDQRTAPRL